MVCFHMPILRLKMYKYIAKQEINHQKIPIKEEYIELLIKMDIEFDEKYLFDWVE